MSKILNRLGVRGQVIRAGYGLTESCAAIMYGVLDPVYEEKEGHEFASIGKPITGAKVRISRDDGKIASLYEIGNLEISGSVVFKAYYNDAVSTRKSFTEDGWYITGDKAYVDSSHKVNMSGRAKEVIVVDGVKYFPVDIEVAVEKASLPGVVPSYIATFPYRLKGFPTESYCIVYGSRPMQDEPMDAISKIASGSIGLRPKWIIPLPQARLDKSSLGKLSRTKIRAEFEKRAYDDCKIEVSRAVREIALRDRAPPQTETESKVVQVLSEMLELSSDEIFGRQNHLRFKNHIC